MKVGILTYHRSVNYGAYMQSFALASRLKEIDGIDVEIIDYTSRKMDIYYKLFTLYRGKNSVFKIKNRIEMYHAFKKGLKKLLLSKFKIISDNNDSVIKRLKDKYDIIIVGSDAVWNFEKRGLPNPYFLIGDIGKTKRISYAASCNGLKYDRVNEEQKTVMKNALQDFQYLGVRDKLTEKVVNDLLGEQKAIHNCDPSLLLDFEKQGLDNSFVNELKGKLIRKYKWDINKRHIGLMLSNLNGSLAKEIISRIKKKYGEEYQIVSVYSYCEYADIKYISDLTPLEWSRIFSLFDLTFSKYFHGTLFSLKNLTPVISLSAEYKVDDIPSKVEDVLSRMELSDFYFEAKNDKELNVDNIMSKAEELLENPPKDRIKQGIMREKEYGEAFIEYIKNSVLGG